MAFKLTNRILQGIPKFMRSTPRPPREARRVITDFGRYMQDPWHPMPKTARQAAADYLRGMRGYHAIGAPKGQGVAKVWSVGNSTGNSPWRETDVHRRTVRKVLNRFTHSLGEQTGPKGGKFVITNTGGKRYVKP
jgi:hypothetical protein